MTCLTGGSFTGLARWSWFGCFFPVYHCVYGHFTFSLTRLTKMKESIKLQKDNKTHCPSGMLVELKAHNILCLLFSTLQIFCLEEAVFHHIQGLYFTLLLKAGSAQHLNHVAQVFFQWGPEYLQGGRLHSLPGQLDPVPHYVPRDKISPITSWSLQRTRIASLSPQ